MEKSKVFAVVLAIMLNGSMAMAQYDGNAVSDGNSYDYNYTTMGGVEQSKQVIENSGLTIAYFVDLAQRVWNVGVGLVQSGWRFVIFVLLATLLLKVLVVGNIPIVSEELAWFISLLVSLGTYPLWATSVNGAWIA